MSLKDLLIGIAVGLFFGSLAWAVFLAGASERLP